MVAATFSQWSQALQAMREAHVFGAVAVTPLRVEKITDSQTLSKSGPFLSRMVIGGNG
jgi:hypothetical protein